MNITGTCENEYNKRTALTFFHGLGRKLGFLLLIYEKIKNRILDKDEM
jgi:hypothetical protein